MINYFTDMKIMQEEYSAAIYIVGPDNEGSYEKTLEFLNKKFKQVIVIGDGESDLLDRNGEGPLLALKTLEQDYSQLLNEGKVFLYVEMHGIVLDDFHALVVSKEGVLLSSKMLFEFLAKNIKKPIDIIFTSCHGKAALMDIDSLPMGSRVIIFSDSDKNTSVVNVVNTLDELSEHIFTLDHFYNNYLAHIFLMNESPVIATVGGENLDPLALSDIYLGKAISALSRQYIHDNFGQSVCRSDIACHNKIDHLIDKIEHSLSIDEFRATADEHYFTLFNEILQIENNYQYNQNSNHQKVAFYSDQESQLCDIEILALKSQADQLLSQYHIPLELDLCDQNWHMIDNEYDTEEGTEEMSNAGMYHFIKYDGFIENNNFDKPEYGEYGYVLGIIKDAYLSDYLTKL